MGRVRFFGSKAQGAVRIADFANLNDGELITIGNQTYEWDNDVSVTPGNVLVTIGGDDATSITNLRDAINANKPTQFPVDAAVDPVDTKTLRIEATSRGAKGNMIFTTDMADADNVITGSGTLENGENGGQQTVHRGKYTVTAIDVLAQNILIKTGIPNSPRFPQVDVVSATGLHKHDLTSLITVVAKDIQIDFDGATNPVEGDVVHWQIWE